MNYSAPFLVIFLLFAISTSVYGQDSCDDGNLAACACENAPILCSIDELNGYVRQMSTTSRPQDGPTPICPGTATATHNPTWFAFTAWCNTLSLRATFSGCTGGTATGAQLAVFADCSFNELVVCNADVNYCSLPTQTMTMNGLNIGQVYYIMLDGCNGTVCEASFEVIGDCGVEEISPWPDPNIYGENTVCLGSTTDYFVFRPDGARQYFWYLDGSLYEESLSQNVSVEWFEPGLHELCVDVANDPCVPVDTPPFEICLTINVVEPRAGFIDTEGSSNLCSGQPVNITVLDNNIDPGAEQLILIVDENGIIIEEIFGSSYYWTPNLDGNYRIYSVNYSPATFFSPGPGANISELGCDEDGACCDASFVEVSVGDPQVFIESQNNIDCNTPSGSFTLQVNNASPPITYSLNGGPFETMNTFTGLAVGTYMVRVQDDNYCVANIEVNITEFLPVLIDNINTTTATCDQANGRITVSSSAMGPTYSINGGAFQTSNVFNGVSAGTYTVTVRDQDGCEATQTVTVGNVAGPGLSLDSQTNIDCATPTGTITVAATGGTAPLQYSLDGINFQAGNTFTGLAVGSYNIRVRDANGCLDNVSTNITETIAVLIDGITPSPAACAQASGSIQVNSSASGATYALNGGAFQPGNTFTNLTPGTYTVAVRNDLGCQATQSVTVGNLPGPNLSLTNTVDIDCTSPTGTITVNATSGTAPLQYSLDGTNFQAGSTFTGLISGPYTVQVRDANGCTDAVTATIAENLPPLIDGTSPTAAACDQATGSITIASSASGARYSLDGGAFQTGNTFTNLTPGNYLITVINDQSCQDSEMVAVGNLPGPSISLDNQIDIDCNTPSGSITLSASSGTGAYEYAIDGTNFQDESTFTGLSAGSYTLTVRDANACTDQVAVQITETLYPLIDDLTATPTACSQATGTITVTSSASGVTYSLDGGPFQTANTFTDLAAGSYTVAVIDENSCEGSQSITVTNPGGPTIALDNQVNIDCNTPAGSITVSATSGVGPYTYSIDGTNFQAANDFTGLAVGNYSVRVRDVNNCVDAIPVQVTANLYDVIDDVATSVAACGQATGSITVNSSATGVSYSLDGGPLQAQNTFGSVAPGSYTVLAIDENNCEATQVVTVDDSAGPTVALDNQINIDCNTPGGSITLSATAGTSPYQYSIDGVNFQDEDTFTDLPVGNYTVRVRDVNACTDDIPVAVTANLYDLIDDIQTQPSACSQAIGSITVSSSANGMSYSLNGGPFQTDNTFADVAAGTYTVDVIDENNCEASQDITVADLPGPTATLDNQVNIDCNTPTGSVDLGATSGTGPYEYSIDGTTFQNEDTFTDLAVGNYMMTVRDANACTDQMALEITANLYDLIDDIETEPSACSQAIGSITVNSSATGMSYSLNGGPFQTDNTFTDVAAGNYTIDVIDENNCETSQAITVDDLPAPSVALANQINIDCNTPAGTITLSATSGTGAYEYSIDGTTFQNEDTFTDLPVGNYTLSVRDANACTDEVMVDITANLYDLIDDIVPMPSACGQAIGSIAVNSSASGMSYSLNGGPFQTENTFTDVAAGTYTIDVIDENNCEASQDVTVNDLDGPTIALDNQINIDCNTPAGTISVSASSGTGAYEYSIDGVNFQADNNFADLPTGNYTISVRDENACLDALAVEITADLYDLIDDIEAAPSACNQAIGSITISSSASGMRYALNGGAFQTDNNFSDLTAGSYTISVIDENNCEDSRTVAVRDLDGPTLGLANQVDIDCNTPGGSITVTASSGTAPYEYSMNGSGFQSTGTFADLAAGSYTVTVRDDNACLDLLTTDVSDNIPLLIQDVQTVATTCGDEDGAITVVSNQPAVQFAVDGANFQTSPQFFNLPAGDYTVNVINDTGCAESVRVNVAPSDPVAVPTIDVIATTCGLDNGVIALTPTGTQNVQYSIANLPYQAVNRFDDLPAGDYTLAMINEEDCEAMASLSIAPSTPLTIEASDVTPSSCGADDGVINLLTNRNPGSLAFSLNGQAVQGRMAGLAPGRYFVDVTDVDNCTESTMVDVGTEICDIYIPNAFSPNKDGSNDFFRIYVPQNLNITIESFAIYDRWGSPMYEFYPQGQTFEMNDMRWDGTINGKPANMGVYVYALVYTDENDYRQVLSGDIILMR